MITLKATLVDAESRKSKISCFRCELGYSARDYNILYDNQKLAYFKFKPPSFKRAKIFCHDCVNKECLNMLKGGIRKVKLIMYTGGDTEIICTFKK
tara:strand:+ start:145 stop:432 length:288 start_codon:yes stop_codon:yes gene_type:complete